MKFILNIIFTTIITSFLLTACTTTNKAIEPPEEIPKKIETKNETKNLETKEKIIIQEKIVYKEKKVPVYIVREPKKIDSKVILGSIEYAYIPSEKLKLKAKIDTGATTTSIHALNIKPFERDGKNWVKFDLVDNNGKLINKTLKVDRVVYIKRHGESNQKRYVVKIRINVANISQLVEVTLTNRDKFEYPLLIGRNFLTGLTLVDVSKKHLHEPIKTLK